MDKENKIYLVYRLSPFYRLYALLDYAAVTRWCPVIAKKINMEAKHLSLTWEGHQDAFVSTFTMLLDRDVLVDCTLAAEGQFLKAHKIVLAACSPYFQLLLSQEYDKHPIIILKDVKFEELKAILTFVYKGEVQIPEHKLASFLGVANSLKVKGLKDHIDKNLINRFDTYLEAVPVIGGDNSSKSELYSVEQSNVSREDFCGNHHDSVVTPVISSSCSLRCQHSSATVRCTSPNESSTSMLCPRSDSGCSLSDIRTSDMPPVIKIESSIEVCVEPDVEVMKSAECVSKGCEDHVTNETMCMQTVIGSSERRGETFITCSNINKLKGNTENFIERQMVLPRGSVISPIFEEEISNKSHVKVKPVVNKDGYANENDSKIPRKRCKNHNNVGNCESASCYGLETFNRNENYSSDMQTDIQNQERFSGTNYSSAYIHTKHNPNRKTQSPIDQETLLIPENCVIVNADSIVKKEPISDVQVEPQYKNVEDQDFNDCGSQSDRIFHLRQSANLSESSTVSNTFSVESDDQSTGNGVEKDISSEHNFNCEFDQYSEVEEDFVEEKPNREEIEIDEIYLNKNNFFDVQEECFEEAERTGEIILPEKSKDKYEKEYMNFVTWRKDQGIHEVNEDMVLSYFVTLRKTMKPSSLWSKYSMLRSTMDLNEKVDISKYRKLNVFLKKCSEKYVPKKAKTLKREQIEKFLTDAPDDEFLLMKIVLLMGIYGACRRDELTNMTVDDVRDNGLYLSVTIPRTKTNKPRSFCVIRENCPVDIIALYKKYVSLRPPKVTHRRLFLQYRNGRCTVQPVGINKVSGIPRMVASYLKLDDPGSYTGHSFRRSSASLLVEGGDLLPLKRYGGWKSSSGSEGYVEDSSWNNIKIARSIMGNNSTNSVNVNVNVRASTSSVNEIVNLQNIGGIHFHGPFEQEQKSCSNKKTSFRSILHD